VPDPTTVTVKVVPAIAAVTLAIAGANKVAMLRKFPMNWQFWKLTLFPVSLIMEVLAVSSVKLGRLVPPPRPTTATSETAIFRAVVLEIVSACPDLTTMISPLPGVH